MTDCRMTTSGKHIPIEKVLYAVGERLSDPSLPYQKSHKYIACFACGLIDDAGYFMFDSSTQSPRKN